MSSLKVIVAVRVRPFNQRELDMGASSIVHMDGKKTRLAKPRMPGSNGAALCRDALSKDNFNEFTFDYSYWSFDHHDDHYVSQEEVYEDLGTDVINCAFQGYNACVFAYGQTGSGKTFTMMGNADNLGLIPRICKSLFARMKVGQEAGTGYKTHVSYLEIYNERVKDLLGSNSSTHGLRVREHKTTGPYVENLSQHPVSDYEEIKECITKGNILRTTASTNMNDTSSRSHAIFTITFVQAGFTDDMPSETVSKIHLVDLAGSERANATGATGQRLKEGAHINKSLVTLGSVISALAEQTNPTNNKRILYIPYRDSVLTWLLKDSLGGNSKTIMIAAISPADCNYGETLSTLRYANRAKNIINKPTVNIDPNVKLIRELREEIMKLRAMLTVDNVEELTSKVLEDLQKKEAQEKVLTEEWTEKWREAQTILREQKSLGLRKSGYGVILDSEMPHLIGIHDDISTGVTLYSLKEGETSIGTDENDNPQDIVLSGVGIQPEHCRIILSDGIATIWPKLPAQCWLNANLIEEPTRISQGDILLLGRTNMFRYNNPAEAAKLRMDLNRSRLDLSRLSLIAASRENLNTSFMSDDESPFRREKVYCPQEMVCREDVEVQEENRKILETIGSALKQLNAERSQMHHQHRMKVAKLSRELNELVQQKKSQEAIFLCREQELNARREMLLWEKSNEEVQHDIKILEDNPLPEDASNLLLNATRNLDNSAAQFLKETVKRNKDEIDKMEKALMEKDQIQCESDKKMKILDGKLTDLDAENQELLLERSHIDIDALNLKKQSMSLNLKKTTDADAQTDMLNVPEELKTLDTSETYHTATSNCSIPSQLLFTPEPESNPCEPCSRHGIMSDSGVSVETNKTHDKSPKEIIMKQCEEDQLSCLSCENSNGSDTGIQLQKLREQIASQKAHIMKTLEADCSDKRELDELIFHLQELQKQKQCLKTELESSIQQTEEHNDLPESLNGSDDCANSSNIAPMGLYENSLYGANTIGQSLSSIETAYQQQQESENQVSIPSFIMRGAGKQTHYEYEVKVCLPDGRWTLLRRYSRFRELHNSMKNLYGEKVKDIPFPRRELFGSKSENVAKSRRRYLEAYLRRLLVVCAKIPQCPIYEGVGGCGVTKQSLVEFSAFFKKGLFESGKHGTG
ncbi:kinesin-like protein Klp98A isoform X2 [Phlebotomus argentipes]|uniref:kinesin-like protein Klp98A isoform X2 n=1 Tax=Phlebotomus argentipes TaxID=94469 RepID=UPI00289300F5|nr:kinesin-like protein Klp98A isoform X2 [Phlebotomus argentipes]